MRPERPASGRPANDRSPTARRLKDQDGVVAGAEALLFGALIFVVGALLTINAWSVMDARMTAEAVARQVARTLVEADDGTGLSGELQSVAAAVMDDMGRPGTPVALGYLRGDGSATTDPGSLLVRCARVTVTATTSTHTTRLPFLDDGWGLPWQVTGRHTEIVDPFRSGLRGEADCDG